ncbi:flagellar protein [Paenibacillus sp. J2TS4]|nr:flagellar protein [Paenibacillus sp. J2TS4]
MLPAVNQKIMLNIFSMDEKESKQQYHSRIADMTDDYIYIQIPINGTSGKLKRLYIGDELEVWFVTEGGLNHYFQTAVLGFREDNITLVVLKKPEPQSITQNQRRSFLRVPANLELSVTVEEQPALIALTEDISGGGISFRSSKDFSVGVQASCWLLIPNKNGKPEHVHFNGEVVRVSPQGNAERMIMMRYTDIAERDRQNIIRYCFEKQIDFRKS